MNKKITINQIEQMINENVNNVIGTKKLSGTNIWFVYFKTSDDIEPAYKSLSEIGFTFSDRETMKRINKQNRVIMATFNGVNETFYGRQLNAFGSGDVPQSQQQKPKEKIACVYDQYTKKNIPVKEVYESFNGWYWYITEYDQDDPNVCYGLVDGFEKEWGWGIYKPELKSQGMKVWSVPKHAWSYTKNIVTVEPEQIEALI